jgi:hypothetical protein
MALRSLVPPFVAASCLLAVPADAGSGLPYDEEPISYSTAAVDDAVARLQPKIDDGRVRLGRDADHGYLRAVLAALQVPVESQVLVFSKTSLQRDRISPRTPRAIYFNDEVYVGWVPEGEVIEVASTDPRQGTIFYVLPQRERPRPRFRRMTHECLQCHDSSAMTGGVPGLMMRSVYPDRAGQPMLAAGGSVTDQESPFAERWGGWYVTGTHGRQRHMGNVTARANDDAITLDREAGANVTDLSERFETSAYLAPGSDIVALMVLAHQTRMHDLLTSAGFDVRRALHDAAAIDAALGRPGAPPSEGTLRRIDVAAAAVVRHLLFAGEPSLIDPVRGTSGFADAFTARGPRDRKGRSLHELDLRRRLLRYPCSYLVYGEAFDALPAPLKERVYARLWDALSGKDRSRDFAHLSASDRRAITDILLDTKPGLPAYFGRDR